MKVSVIIPNWNGRFLLERNLPLVIEAKENAKNQILEIIIVDDKSLDDSVDYLVKNFKGKVRLVKHNLNRGFSSTVNTGIRSAKGKLVCLLNTDVIPEKDFLVSVLPHFEDNKVFGVSLHEKGYGGARGFLKSGFFEHQPLVEKSKSYETFWVSGGSAVLRRDLIVKIGSFDEKIFSPFYWEDVDLSYRAMKRGYKLIWEPSARVIHKHESIINSSNFKTRKLSIVRQRNKLLFIWKNLTSKNLFRKHLVGLVRRVSRHPGYVVVLVAALRKYKMVMRARQKEGRESIVSDEAIFARFEK